MSVATTAVARNRRVMLSACGKCGRRGEGFKKCRGCKMITYCSRDCQLAHWRGPDGHKRDCASLAKQREKQKAVFEASPAAAAAAAAAAAVGAPQRGASGGSGGDGGGAAGRTVASTAARTQSTHARQIRMHTCARELLVQSATRFTGCL